MRVSKTCATRLCGLFYGENTRCYGKSHFAVAEFSFELNAGILFNDGFRQSSCGTRGASRA